MSFRLPSVVMNHKYWFHLLAVNHFTHESEAGGNDCVTRLYNQSEVFKSVCFKCFVESVTIILIRWLVGEYPEKASANIHVV